MARLQRQGPKAPRLFARALAALLAVAALVAVSSLSWCHAPQQPSGADSSVAGRDPGRQRIPKILHRVFLSGREAFDALHDRPDSSIRAEWDDWCRLIHENAGWKHMFWDNATVNALLEEHYAWFLPTWRQYNKRVLRSDAIRPFILHRYGGLYLDLDIECYRDGYDMLQGADVVLQATISGENITNAAMAGVPGHELWDRVMRQLDSRRGQDDPTHATGPEPVAAAFYSLGVVNPPWHKDEKEGGPEWYKWAANGTHTWQGSTIKVYRLGEWYTPCWFSEQHCHKDQAEKRKAGLLATQPNVVGHHHYEGTWWDISHKKGKENDPSRQDDKPNRLLR